MSGITPFCATLILNALFNGSPFDYACVYVQLHVGDPGPLCTANVAVNSTRCAVPNGNAANGTFTSSGPITWTNIPASETYTYISLWDAIIGGDPLWSGPLTDPASVNEGDLTFTIGTNALTVSVA